MRKLNDLSEARKKYHESIGFDHSRVPEGHIQVEYPRRSMKRSSRTGRSPRGRFLPLPQASQSTISAKKDNTSAGTKSSTPEPSQLVDMRSAESNASSGQYLDRSGKPVQGYESHCTSSETHKPKQRPQNIVTKKTWSKVLPTVIEHNPISFKPAAGKDTTEKGEEDGGSGNKDARSGRRSVKG